MTSNASGRGNIGYTLESSDYADNNQDLIDKVIELEKEQAEKI